MIQIFDGTPEWGGEKVNFVDGKNTLLGYDLGQDCCEHAGWYISDKEENITKGSNEGEFDLSEYSFDREYFTEDESECETYVARFKLVDTSWRSKDRGPDLFIHLFNCHNGYYSHGFEFSTPTKTGAL